jgi:chromosome segregation protein
LQTFEAAREARNAAQDAVKQLRRTLPDLERKERAAQAALTQYETDIARESAEKRALEDRLERLGKETAEVKRQLSEAEETEKVLSQASDLTEDLNALSEKLSKARGAADEANAAFRTLKNEVDARQARLTSIETETSDWKSRSAIATERVTTLTGRLDAAQIALKASTDGPDQFETRRSKLFSDLEVAETRRSTAADTLALAETAVREAEHLARQAESLHNEAREQRAAAQARLTAAQERISETQARIGETLSCEPIDLPKHLGELSEDSGLSESDIEKKLERLQKERERMGGVNLRADVEAAEQEERLSAMNDERTDLVAAIARLREGIDELNAEGRERLLKAFDVVNGHFGRLFTTLFGGGEASLALTESDDPLEAGLEIMVSPPGKKLGSMSLMSGGEQALTATALIFAVFLSNPAPICVLDEVDAPLDDANVSRYCNLLDAMTEQTHTKFIAITHNPVTMSRMNRLFGVTMAEQGVSQLVSMELSSATRLVAS